ncbi:MAG: hypothetical protein B9S32_01255 [Verrucomicrobia bacterium Tous-C9LFEB]|nr:MAG: hypothetical protein B9S32_01255 [Verrucomicrobia bacterium Tous-C9LFEB]
MARDHSFVNGNGGSAESDQCSQEELFGFGAREHWYVEILAMSAQNKSSREGDEDDLSDKQAEG